MNDTDIFVRRAEAGDVAALASIGTTTYVETFGHIYSDKDLATFLSENRNEAYFEPYLSDDRFCVWLVECDGAAIGYGLAGPCTLPVPDMPPNSGELVHMYLSAAHQGRGVGRRLMAEIMGWLKENFDQLYLCVFSENKTAQNIYQRNGFEKIMDHVFMVGDHADAEWIMAKKR
ncbi:MAG: GNAT family N-acetyltransferase [Pseudomonadota bacterium]